jgi:U3 small nucleolar RNA-associated protein 14
VQQAQAKAAASREDAGKAHVILNEKRNKKSVKYEPPIFVLLVPNNACMQVHG